MTKHECAVIMAYTGTCTLVGKDLNYFYAYASELLGRDVYSHEMPAIANELKEKSKIDFIRICQGASDVKQDGYTVSIPDGSKQFFPTCSLCDGEVQL